MCRSADASENKQRHRPCHCQYRRNIETIHKYKSCRSHGSFFIFLLSSPIIIGTKKLPLPQIPPSPTVHHGLPRDRNRIRHQGSQAVRFTRLTWRSPIDRINRWQSFHKEEFKLKTFKEDDVDIAIDACGVCGSDVHCEMFDTNGRTTANTISYHWRLGRDSPSSLCRTRNHR